MAGKKKKQRNASASQVMQMLQKLAVVGAPAPTQKKSRKRRKKLGLGSGVSDDGVIHLHRSELVSSVSLDANASTSKGIVAIKPSSFSFLKNLSSSFDRLRWNSLEFYYKPAVGTVYGGLVSLGVDWDGSSAAKDWNRQKISSLTPNSSSAAWADTQANPLRLPTNKLQSRLWYTPNTGSDLNDQGPGNLVWAVDGKSDSSKFTVGEIWAKYSVTMAGTSPS